MKTVFDAGIGDTFGARVAGNIATSELIGSMEYSCAVAGSKLVLVLGHTACGAIGGAIDQVRLGKLTGLLKQIRPVVDATRYDGPRNGKNAEFVNAVARANVLHTMQHIREQSLVLKGLEAHGNIKIMGAMYDLDTGMVTFMET